MEFYKPQKGIVEEVVLRVLKSELTTNSADVLLLSGGIDSSLLAALDRTVPAMTVGYVDRSEDLVQARMVSDYLGLDWQGIPISEQLALENLRELMMLRNSYDLGLLNDIPIYTAIKYGRSLGMRTFRTSDAADTFFVGYDYLQSGKINISSYLKELRPFFRVSSTAFARKMDARMHFPYLNKELLDIATSVDPTLHTQRLISDKPGDIVNDNNNSVDHVWGKMILRRAGIGLLPPSTLWRTKTDLQFGSGMDLLNQRLFSFNHAAVEDDVKHEEKHFWNPAHLQLYVWFKEMG